jgi:hypothetical protein
MIRTIESIYPDNFRSAETETLIAALRSNYSLELVGMKRVGISNFLRFLLSHQNQLEGGSEFVFIPVDLNDLVERAIFPFWRLSLKRIVDAVAASNADEQLKERLSHLLGSAIQFKDLFLTYDAVRETLVAITEAGLKPVIFFIRFDRLKGVITADLYNNLKGLRDACGQNLNYVFTSYRPLSFIAPYVFGKATFTGFSKVIYIRPLDYADFKNLVKIQALRSGISMHPGLSDWLFSITGGHVHYALLCLIVMQENKSKLRKLEELYALFKKDERISMESEELFTSLERSEQNLILGGLPAKIPAGSYLLESGLLTGKPGKYKIFSPFFAEYLAELSLKQQQSSTTLTRKENSLFDLLREKENTIVPREELALTVWPEYKEIGISDWSIDRLVSRLRNKLKQMSPEFQIKTVRTRGFKLQRF